ncbi:hypothetical protein [Helicobacter sp. 23-1046]
MRKLMVSCALSAAMAMPAMAAVEVYSDSETQTSVKMYGVLYGYSGAAGKTGQESTVGADYLQGLQLNSRLGFDTTIDKFFIRFELGAVEPNILTGATTNAPGIRKFFWQYDLGSAGKISVGRDDSPTVEGGFNSDFLATDTGSTGFGSVITGNRDMQVAYSNGGYKVALITDHYRKSEIPRISMAYQFRNKGIIKNFKVGATYKYYNHSVGPLPTNVTTPTGVGGAHAWNVLAGIKPQFGPLSLSVFLSYGVNAHLYGEMRTSAGQGEFNYATIDAGLNAKRGGGFFELSYAASQKLAITLGSGFQLTYGGNGGGTGYTASGADEHILSYKVSLQTPYKVSKNFSIVPQIGYYNAYLRRADVHRGSAIGIVRFRFDI